MTVDPIAFARRLLSQKQAELVQKIIAAGSSVVSGVADEVSRYFETAFRDFMLTLGKMPHAAANWLLDRDRGPRARRLTPVEKNLVLDAFGRRINPDDLRIVRGPGLSIWATIAHKKGNPAITLGNTVYITYFPPDGLKDIDYADLSMTASGVNLLLHEYTHAIQYHTLGFGQFGSRYAADLKAHRFNPGELYRYNKRNKHWRDETLEGQAQIVGDYAGMLQLKQDPATRAQLAKLRAKLSGTGIYAN